MRIGVDFDGTLAFYDEWRGAAHCGAPVVPMVRLVQRLIANGDEVVIFTARVHPCNGRDAGVAEAAIRKWCRRHLGMELEVTCMKAPDIELYLDDRAVQVIANTGVLVRVSTA
jgi:hypothetical protein